MEMEEKGESQQECIAMEAKGESLGETDWQGQGGEGKANHSTMVFPFGWYFLQGINLPIFFTVHLLLRLVTQ